MEAVVLIVSFLAGMVSTLYYATMLHKTHKFASALAFALFLLDVFALFWYVGALIVIEQLQIFGGI